MSHYILHRGERSAPRFGRLLLPLATAALALLTALPAQADGSQPDSVQANAAQQAARKPAAPADCALPGRTGWTDEGHDTDPAQFLRPDGKIRAAMLFVDFPDAPATESTTEDAAQLTPAADWLREASYGDARLSITPINRWMRMPQNANTYGFERGITFEQHELYVGQAVAAADPYVDFGDYDIVYVVPTKAAGAITFSPTYLFDPGTTGVVADGKRVKWAVTFGQDMWRWGFKVLSHETGHIFGLPDLYAFSGETHGYVGGWDVMGLISGASPRYSGWHSWKLGWIDDKEVACLDAAGQSTVKLSPIESKGGGTKLAVVRTGPTTAYVAEARRAEGLDSAACSSGVLIYKVDSAAQTGAGPMRVMDSTPGSTPGNGCLPLDDGAYQPGQSFTDAATGVRIDVLKANGGHTTVRVSRT